VGSEHHLDVTKETENFLKYFERLSRLPLVTDGEMASLFGEAVNSALAELEADNQQQSICARCANRCCLLVDCELYTPELSNCPIKSCRPLLCRMHFCNQFSLNYPVLVKEVGDIFLESLLAAERLDKNNAALFDSPPLSTHIPELVNIIKSLLMDFKKGLLDEANVLQLIQSELNRV